MIESEVSSVAPTTITEEQAKIYDRQIRLWGLETQQRLSSSNLLVIGLSGINLEAAKNLLLAGIRLTFCNGHVPLTAQSLVSPPSLHPSHLQYNLFGTSNDASQIKTSDEVLVSTVEQLRLLNPFVHIDILTDDELSGCLSMPQDSAQHPLLQFSGILVSAESIALEDLINLNIFCRETNKGFFMPRSFGIHGAIFQDYGKAFEAEGNLMGQVVEKRVVEFPSLETVLSIPVEQLPSGKKHKAVPNKKLLVLYAVLRNQKLRGSTDDKLGNPTDFIEFGVEQFKQAGIIPDGSNGSSIRNLLAEWKRMDGLAFPTASAVLGGLLAQEIQRFVSRQFTTSKDRQYRNSSFNNFIIFCSTDSEGLVFDVGIQQRLKE